MGLVSSACFAELGHNASIIEIDEDKVEAIDSGRPPIYEKGLDDLLSKHAGRNLQAITSYDEVPYSDLSFICVGTPPGPDGNADLSMVTSASRSIGK